MVTKSSSFLVLFLTTLGMITSIIPTIDAQKVIPNDVNPMQLPQQLPQQQQQGQQSQFQYNTQDFQTFTKYMDMYNELYPPQPQQPTPQQQGSNYYDFLTFMQYLQYYDNLYGQKDYIIKHYHDDDDNDDNDYKYKYKYKYKNEYENWKKHDGHGDGKKSNYPSKQFHPITKTKATNTIEQECKQNTGKMNNGKCDIKNPDDQIEFEHELADEGLWPEYTVAQQAQNFLSEANVEKSIGFPGEYEPGYKKTDAQKRAEEAEFVAELEDDLQDANTPEQKEKIQSQIKQAKEKFGLNDDETEKQPEPTEVNNVSPQVDLVQQQQVQEQQPQIHYSQGSYEEELSSDDTEGSSYEEEESDDNSEPSSYEEEESSDEESDDSGDDDSSEESDDSSDDSDDGGGDDGGDDGGGDDGGGEE